MSIFETRKVEHLLCSPFLDTPLPLMIIKLLTTFLPLPGAQLLQYSKISAKKKAILILIWWRTQMFYLSICFVDILGGVSSSLVYMAFIDDLYERKVQIWGSARLFY